MAAETASYVEWRVWLLWRRYKGDGSERMCIMDKCPVGIYGLTSILCVISTLNRCVTSFVFVPWMWQETQGNSVNNKNHGMIEENITINAICETQI